MKRYSRRRERRGRLLWTFLMALAVLLGCFWAYFWLLSPVMNRQGSWPGAEGRGSLPRFLEGEHPAGTEGAARQEPEPHPMSTP